MREIREALNAIVYIVFVGIILLLVPRFLLEILNYEVSWFFNFTNFLLTPFDGLLFDYPLGDNSIDLTVPIAILSYLLLGSLISDIVSAIFNSDLRAIVIEIATFFFKLMEYLLIYRIFLKFFGGPDSAGLREFTYGLSDSLVGVLTALVNIPEISAVNGTFDLAALIVLAIIILIDILIETVLVTALYEEGETKHSRRVVVIRRFFNSKGEETKTEKSFHSVK